MIGNTPSQHLISFLIQSSKEKKKRQIRKEETKLSLFSESKIVYLKKSQRIS